MRPSPIGTLLIKGPQGGWREKASHPGRSNGTLYSGIQGARREKVGFEVAHDGERKKRDNVWAYKGRIVLSKPRFLLPKLGVYLVG